MSPKTQNRTKTKPSAAPLLPPPSDDPHRARLTASARELGELLGAAGRRHMEAQLANEAVASVSVGDPKKAAALVDRIHGATAALLRELEELRPPDGQRTLETDRRMIEHITPRLSALFVDVAQANGAMKPTVSARAFMDRIVGEATAPGRVLANPAQWGPAQWAERVWALCGMLSEAGGISEMPLPSALAFLIGVPGGGLWAAAHEAVTRDVDERAAGGRFLAPVPREARELACDLLRVELRREWGRIREALGLVDPPPSDPPEAAREWLCEQDGMLRLDAAFADELAEIGPTGRRIAQELRRAGRDRWAAYQAGGGVGEVWKLWLDPDQPFFLSRWPKALSAALWHDRVRARWEELRRIPPAVSMAVLDRVILPQARDITVHREETQSLLVARDGKSVVATLPVGTFDAAIRGSRELGSLNGHRLLRWEVLQAHGQMQRGQTDPRRLVVQGGWAGLSETVGAGTNKRAAESLRDLVMAQAQLLFSWPDGSRGNLIAFRSRDEAPGRPAELEIILGSMLMSGYVQTLPKAARSRGRQLVPLLPLPPLVGRPNEHAAQAAFQIFLLAHMREHADELVMEGGVRLDAMILAELAKRADLPFNTLQRVMERWLRDDDDGPAFLQRVEEERYSLGGAHADALGFLQDAGRMMSAGRERGRRSAQQRRAARPGVRPLPFGDEEG